MRSRPDVALFLTPNRPTAGREMIVEAVVTSRSRTPTTGIAFSLRGVESRQTGKMYETHTHLSLAGDVDVTELPEGEHRYRISFALPLDLPPSYRGVLATVEYELLIRVLIPWWPDRLERYVLPIAAAPTAPHTARPSIFCTHPGGPKERELCVELSLDRTEAEPGGIVSGAVSLSNVQFARVKRIEVSLVATESSTDSSFPMSDEGQRFSFVVADSPPSDGESIPFRIRLPEHITATFSGRLARLEWGLEVRAVISFGSDVCFAVPFVIRDIDAEFLPDALPSRVDAAPPVGRERRALVWAHVAHSFGMANDAANERMTVDFQGVSMSIALEERADEGVFTTAALKWPRLGLDVQVTEKRWWDVWTRGDVVADDASRPESTVFFKRFSVRGREAAQVLAYLDDETRAALEHVEQVLLDDEGCLLAARGAASSTEELGRFVEAAMNALRVLANARARIVPPEAMRPYVEGWRAYAQKIHGRLEVGRMWIHDGNYDGRRVTIGTRWSDEGEMACLVVQCALDWSTDSPAAKDEELERSARALREQLAPSIRALRVSREFIECELPAPLEDPRTAEPILDALTRAANQLRAPRQGPYR